MNGLDVSFAQPSAFEQLSVSLNDSGWFDPTDALKKIFSELEDLTYQSTPLTQ